MIKKVLGFLKIFLSMKIKFFKPEKVDILLYDQGIKFNYLFQRSFKKFKFDIFYRRYESINIYIMFKTILRSQLKNIKINYLKNYIEETSPKVIVTCNDIDSTFYQIKNIINPKVIMIALQLNFRISSDFKSFTKMKNEYKVDYLFTFSNFFSNYYSKILTSKKIIPAGSFMNNYYTKNLKKKKKYDILFISQFKRNLFEKKIYYKEKKLLEILQKYCSKNKKKFKIAIKTLDNSSYNEEENFINSQNIYIKYFRIVKKNNLLSYSKNFSNYKNLDMAKVVLTMDSTLGLEAFARGNKVLAFPTYKSFSKKDFFISYEPNYKFFKRKIETIMNLSDKSYFKNASKSIFNINYNYENQKLKKIVNYHVKKN